MDDDAFIKAVIDRLDVHDLIDILDLDIEELVDRCYEDITKVRRVEVMEFLKYGL